MVYPGFKRPVTVIAVEECLIFKLDRKDFKRLIPVNSELYTRMRKVVKDQIAVLLKIENEEMNGNGFAESMSNVIIDRNSSDKQSSNLDDESEEDSETSSNKQDSRN